MTVTEAYSEVAERLAQINPLGISNLPSLESISERVEELVYKKKDGNITNDEAVELERYLSLDLLISLAKTKAKHMITDAGNSHPVMNYSEEEQALIEKIREGVSPEITQRFHQLNQVQRERKLRDTEQKELEELIFKMETADAKFLEAMIKLSKIWGVTTKEVRTKLDIQIPEPYVY